MPGGSSRVVKGSWVSQAICEEGFVSLVVFESPEVGESPEAGELPGAGGLLEVGESPESCELLEVDMRSERAVVGVAALAYKENLTDALAPAHIFFYLYGLLSVHPTAMLPTHPTGYDRETAAW